jgi:hypothetical protein
MTDETQNETTPRKRGRPPKHIQRQPLHKPVHGHDDDGRIEQYDWVPYEAADKYFIPQETVKAFERDWGQALVWAALEVAGKPLNDLMAHRMRNHWKVMPAGEADGMFDYLGIRDGVIRVENHVLMYRPIEVERKARAHDKRMAEAAITNMRRSHAEEGIDVPMPEGGRHPSARAQNRHRTSFEEGPKIPD